MDDVVRVIISTPTTELRIEDDVVLVTVLEEEPPIVVLAEVDAS